MIMFILLKFARFSLYRDSLESPQLSIDEDNMDLYILDASPMLVSHVAPPPSASGKASADGPEVKGAEPHILMVYACSPDLKGMQCKQVQMFKKIGQLLPNSKLSGCRFEIP